MGSLSEYRHITNDTIFSTNTTYGSSKMCKKAIYGLSMCRNQMLTTAERCLISSKTGLQPGLKVASNKLAAFAVYGQKQFFDHLNSYLDIYTRTLNAPLSYIYDELHNDIFACRCCDSQWVGVLPVQSRRPGL